jgi:hypothetical protein
MAEQQVRMMEMEEKMEEAGEETEKKQKSCTNSSEGRVKTNGGQTTRRIQINPSLFDENGGKTSGPFQLLIRRKEAAAENGIPGYEQRLNADNLSHKKAKMW